MGGRDDYVSFIVQKDKIKSLEFGLKYEHDVGNFRYWGGYFYQKIIF